MLAILLYRTFKKDLAKFRHIKYMTNSHLNPKPEATVSKMRLPHSAKGDNRAGIPSCLRELLSGHKFLAPQRNPRMLFEIRQESQKNLVLSIS